MADQNVAALLAALAGGTQQRPPGAPGAAPISTGYPLPAGLNAAGTQAPAAINSPPTAFALPQPTSSGSLDLSTIKPSVSGRVSLDDALAKVKAKSAESGARDGGSGARYDEPRGRFRGRSRSRSRTPPRRGPDPYRDAYSTFRDERRGRGNDNSRDRDRSFSPPTRRYSPPPRERDRYGGGPGAGRTRSPAPEMEQLNIDASLVGLIIGRGGENLRRVEAETGARVQFMTNGHDRDSGGERMCNIQGTRQQITSARRAIEQIITENEKSGSAAPPKKFQPTGANAAGGTGSGALTMRDGEESTQIYVPDRTVGLIIGRGGETIRDIQDKSGCHVNIVGEAKSQNGQRPVNLIGSPAASEYAKRLIMEIVESDTTGGPPGPPPRTADRGPAGNFGGGDGPRVTETIRVPIDAVGMIIGKGGETIKEMQNSTGCRINVSSQYNPNDQEREISLAGARDAIIRARQAIDEKVEASMNKSRGGGRGGGGGRGANSSGDGQFGGAGAAGSTDWASYAAAAAAAAAAGSQQPATSGAPGAEDPYAAYGGYQNYCAMYYAAMMQQQATGGAGAGPGGSGVGGGPPGT